ncbi:hypothetical protein [Sinomonas humi]|uniref:hypothetical protein n=1 Tax=Sinomonas humi TaxID=1338436 RepID=UPI0012E0B23A|nr:hypothetical protein [Sinomonas humi]
MQERVVGEDALEPHVAIVAAANPTDTAVDAYDLAPAMANRFLHLDWQFDSGVWLDNIVTGFDHVQYPALDRILSADPSTRRAVVAGQVATFIKNNSRHLAPEPPKDLTKAGKAWPSPRSWSNAIEVLAQLEPEDMEAARLVLEGLVGHGAGTEYLAWVAANDLYDPLEVMNDPSIVDFGARPDKLFALAQSVTALGLLSDANWSPAAHVLTVFAENGKPDVAMPGATKLLNQLPKGKRVPERFRAAFMALFQHTQHRVVAAA